MPAFTEQLLYGAGITVLLAICSAILALFLSIFLAGMSRSTKAILRIPAQLYIDLIRSIPEILIIFMIYYGTTTLLTNAFGEYTELGPFFAGVLALGLVFAAYCGEVVGGAVDSISAGQSEAGKALGLGTIQVFFLVVLPQVVRVAMPGLANLWLILIKETSLVSVIGLEELMRQSSIAAGVKHNPMLYYSLGAAMYLGITAVSEFGFRRWIARLNRYVQS